MCVNVCVCGLCVRIYIIHLTGTLINDVGEVKLVQGTVSVTTRVREGERVRSGEDREVRVTRSGSFFCNDLLYKGDSVLQTVLLKSCSL